MEKLIERIDGYVKLYFQLIVGWFTFFVTINWASIGWLAANFAMLKSNGLASKVAIIFGWQNILGIGIVICAAIYFYKEKTRLEFLERSEYKQEISSSEFLFKIIFVSLAGMILALLPMCILWFWASANLG